MFTQSNYDYLQRVKRDNINTDYVQKRITLFTNQIENMKQFAELKQGNVRNNLLPRIRQYESLLDELKSY
jgi:hypothetical protein